METKPGSRWKSTVCTTEVIVVRATVGPIDVHCGGVPMIEVGGECPQGATPDTTLLGGTQLGKRYALEGLGLELLCTKAGEGTLTVDGTELAMKSPKPLPASD